MSFGVSPASMVGSGTLVSRRVTLASKFTRQVERASTTWPAVLASIVTSSATSGCRWDMTAALLGGTRMWALGAMAGAILEKNASAHAFTARWSRIDSAEVLPL